MRARVLVPLFAVLIAGVCVRLAIWQIHRLDERRAHNARARAVLAAPRQEITGAGIVEPYRRVRLSGRWDYAHEIILRQQTLEGTPGLTFVTPLIVDSAARAVLVVRGFVPSPDGLSLPPFSTREGDTATVLGTALALPTRQDLGRPLTRNGVTTCARLDSIAIARRVPVPVMGIYVVEEELRPRNHFPERLTVPPLDDGPHLSYAIQWFAFATIALVGGVTVAVRGRTQ